MSHPIEFNPVYAATGQQGKAEAERRFGEQPDAQPESRRDPGGSADSYRAERAAAINPIYRAAIETLPGYPQARAIAEQAERLLTETPVPVNDLPDPMATGTITEEWLTAMAEADNAAAAADHRRRILVDLRNNARSTVGSIVAVHIDGLLAALNDALADVIARGRAIAADLDGARTPAEAITNGPDAARAWANLGALLTEYKQVRAAQDMAMAGHIYQVQRARSNDNDDTRATDLLLRNLDDIAPNWRQPGADYSGKSMWVAPWPTDEVEYLVWLLTSDAEPWVPTLAQLENHFDSRQPAPIKTAPSPLPKASGNGFVRVVNAPRSPR